MKRKISLKKRLRYWIDDKMSKGTASMIKLLLFTVLSVVIVVTALVMAFHLGGEGRSVIAVFWDNLRSAMSSSFPASNAGSLLYIVLYTLLGLTGMIFTGMLVGIFSSTMRGKIIALQKENPEIIESGHSVILGFRMGEFALLSEMIAAAGTEKRTIVVVENMDREDMEQAIAIQESFMSTGNRVMDVILTTKSLQCQKKKITLNAMVDGDLLADIHVKDICSLFGNVLDNAIEATQQLEDEEKRIITLSVRRRNQFIIVECENCSDSANVRLRSSHTRRRFIKDNCLFGLFCKFKFFFHFSCFSS